MSSLLSLKKITYPSVSILSYWDDTSSFDKTAEVRRFAKLRSSTIGRYSRVNPYCSLRNADVGNFCAIGEGTIIGPGYHPMNYLSTHSIFYKKGRMTTRWVKPLEFPERRAQIDGDVWVGMGALIIDGVTIGPGAVIGARSVVTKDVPPYAIVAGSPARVVRYRFEESIVKRLLASRWWDMADDDIDEIVGLFHEAVITEKVLERYGL